MICLQKIPRIIKSVHHGFPLIFQKIMNIPKKVSKKDVDYCKSAPEVPSLAFSSSRGYED